MDPTRRDFLSRLAMWSSLVASYGTAAVHVVRFLIPAIRRASLRKVFVCRAADLPAGASRVVGDLRGGAVVLANTPAGLRCLSTRCTHLGCRVHWDAPNRRFVCPCHMGVFDSDGRVVSGPPPAPLPRYDVTEEGGMIYVAMKEP